MQINAINNRNFNGIIVPIAIKTKLEKNIASAVDFNPEKMAEIPRLISNIKHNFSNINIRVAAKQGATDLRAENSYDVFIERGPNVSRTIIEEGSNLGEKFINALSQVSKMAQ